MPRRIEIFYEEIVAPCVRAFEASRSDVRLAYCAVWALDSYASHIFYFYRERCGLHESGDIAFKKEKLVPGSVDFKVILDVSAATKHATRSNRDTSKISVYSSSDVSSENVDGWAAYFAGPVADEWGQQVIVNNDKHLFSPLLPKVLRAEKFLREEEAALARLANHADKGGQ